MCMLLDTMVSEEIINISNLTITYGVPGEDLELGLFQEIQAGLWCSLLRPQLRYGGPLLTWDIRLRSRTVYTESSIQTTDLVISLLWWGEVENWMTLLGGSAKGWLGGLLSYSHL